MNITSVKLAQIIQATAEQMAETQEAIAREMEIEDTTAQAARDAKDAYQLELTQALLPEYAKDGRINGKNAEIRQMQQTVVAAELVKSDPAIKFAWEELCRCEEAHNTAKARRQALVDRFSVLRNTARMYAGLGYAIGG
jgi:hypothetical protein